MWLYICWQVRTDITQQTAVATNKCCHNVGLRKQHLGYHNSWECWCFILLYGLCVALCWCRQCLLTVGGNWLPHTVTPLDVTTWHDAAERHRTYYTLQNVRQQHCKHHSDSGQQVSALPYIALEDKTICLLQKNAFNII